MKNSCAGNRKKISGISELFCCLLFDTAWQMCTGFFCSPGGSTDPAAYLFQKPMLFERNVLGLIFGHSLCGAVEIILSNILDGSYVLVVESRMYAVCLGAIWLSGRNACNGNGYFYPAQARK